MELISVTGFMCMILMNTFQFDRTNILSNVINNKTLIELYMGLTCSWFRMLYRTDSKSTVQIAP